MTNWESKRANFGLADLFGCDYVKTENGVKNSYLTPRHPHTLTRGLEDAPRIIATAQQITVKAHDDAKLPLDAGAQLSRPADGTGLYDDAADRTSPMAFCRQVGKGRVVYFPMDLDRTFWEVLAPDHLVLLRNAVDWAAEEPHPMTVTWDRVWWTFPIGGRRTALAAHIVNMNNPMMMKGLLSRKLLPAGPYHRVAGDSGGREGRRSQAAGKRRGAQDFTRRRTAGGGGAEDPPA